MAKRKIIKIDEEKCNGCGACITGCAEGALALVDGKAKLVKEQYCDGFGDCIGHCPAGALTIVEEEADRFDYEATKNYLLQTRGKKGVKNFEDAHSRHAEVEAKQTAGRGNPMGGCPGTMAKAGFNKGAADLGPTKIAEASQAIRSELNQWPVQLHLVQPGMDCFKNKELVVLSTCSPIASADVHWRFMRGRSVVVGCPKLDRTEGYIEKLAAILSEKSIPKVIVLRMEVPCCGGLTMIARQAVEQCGRSNLAFEEVIVGVQGDIGS
jgi:ferredoxin